MDFFEKMTGIEQINFLILAKVNLTLEKKELKSDFITVLEEYWNERGEMFSEHELNKLRKYAGKSVYRICDDKNQGHYFILEDNNIVIPQNCFKS